MVSLPGEIALLKHIKDDTSDKDPLLFHSSLSISFAVFKCEICHYVSNCPIMFIQSIQVYCSWKRPGLFWEEFFHHIIAYFGMFEGGMSIRIQPLMVLHALTFFKNIKVPDGTFQAITLRHEWVNPSMPAAIQTELSSNHIELNQKYFFQ